MTHIYMSQGERAGIEGFSLLAEDHVPGGISAAALLTYYDFKELADCDAWLAHYLADEDGFALAVACKGYAPPHLRTSAPPYLRASAPSHLCRCNCLKMRRSLDTPTKVTASTASSMQN